MAYYQLKLENQLCFPLYAASHLMTKQYQPYLEKMGITYPQYLVLLLLWEHEKMTVNHIAESLILKTNTVTPLLKRMESMDLIQRQKDESDSRKVIIRLTEKGIKLQEFAAEIPSKLSEKILIDSFTKREFYQLKTLLDTFVNNLKAEDTQ
jgi:MarR family transcriptional regulator, organic hydroperoxide resistance regulator